MIIFSLIYIFFLFCYFITRVGNNIKYRAINKYILASMYLVYAIVMFFMNGLSDHHYVLIVALLFSFLGDIFLVFDFSKGGYFFLTSNIFFVVYYITSLINGEIKFINYFWILLVWLLLISIFIICCKKFPNVFKLGKMKKPMTLYLSSVTLNGLFGLTCALFLKTTPFIVRGIGSLLFMISDYILTVDRFIIKKNKWIVRGNSLTYFVGLLLIALSVGL